MIDGLKRGFTWEMVNRKREGLRENVWCDKVSRMDVPAINIIFGGAMVDTSRLIRRWSKMLCYDLGTLTPSEMKSTQICRNDPFFY